MHKNYDSFRIKQMEQLLSSNSIKEYEKGPTSGQAPGFLQASALLIAPQNEGRNLLVPLNESSPRRGFRHRVLVHSLSACGVFCGFTVEVRGVQVFGFSLVKGCPVLPLPLLDPRPLRTL